MKKIFEKTKTGILCAIVVSCGLLANSIAAAEKPGGPGAEHLGYDDEEAMDLVDLIGSHSDTSHFADILGRSGLSADLRSHNRKKTVFVPSNAALENLPEATLATLRTYPAAAAEFVKAHVVKTDLAADDLRGNDGIESLANTPLVFNTEHGYSVDESSVVQSDIVATNGRVHVLDNILGELSTS